MEGLLPIFFPSVVPVAYLLYMAWSVLRRTPANGQSPGPDPHDPRRWHRDPRRPRDPRRGPHAPAADAAGRRIGRGHEKAVRG